MNKSVLSVVVCAAMLVTTGCVTGRRSIDLATPAGPTPVAASGKGTFAITAIADQRKFENSPSLPSTPSIDGDVTKVGKDTLSTMIGRQRNGFGKAMGDVELKNGNTVQNWTRTLVEQGFAKRGYVVASSAGDVTAEVDVNKFWGWFTPGFASISFEAELSSEIRVNRGGTMQTLTVNGYGKNTGQVASDDNWKLAFSRAFEDFLKNLDAALTGASL